ncbi:MAG: nitrogen fixation protein NifH [Dehalococcoidales bacterium]|nr:nitrogen fixation protein NifH [Dehalococcoidales bacterium]
MANWKDKLNGDPIPWLLENDRSRPAVRYYALRDILGRDENDNEVKAAKSAVMTSGPVPVILAAQQPEGYWGKRPKYSGTLPAIVFMAQLGADGADPRIRTSCEFLLSRYIDSNGCLMGGLSLKDAPSFNYCNTGNIGAALIDFGWLNDRRLQRAMELLAQTITGEGVTDVSERDMSKGHDKSGNSPPPFTCSANGNLPCAWGAIKAMIALNKVPPAKRTTNMNKAIKLGVDFLLSHDPAVADYPFGRGNRPSTNWFKFRYPLGTTADMLQNLEILAALGQAENPKLANALDLVISKQNQQGRWLLGHTYKELADTQEKKVFYWYQNSLRLYITYKEYVDIQPEKKGQPSKWVTLRALRVLKTAFPEKG